MKIDFNVILENSAAKYKKEFVKCFPDRGIQLTFSDIERYSIQIACWMLDKGIRAEEKIALWMGNCPEFLLLFAAGLRIGAVMVPINVYLGRDVVNQFCKDNDCKILFWDSRNHVIQKQIEQKTENWDFSDIEAVNINEVRGYLNDTKGIRLPFKTADVRIRKLRCERNITDDLIILYTSGSTGNVRAVRKSVKSYFGANGFPKVFLNAMAFGKKFFFLNVFSSCPWYHNTGIYLILITLFGLVYQEITVERFQPVNVVEYIETYVPKVWLGTASMLYRCCISRKIDSNKMPSFIISSGEELPYHVIRTIASSCKSCFLYSGYGLTEAGAISHLCYEFGQPSWLVRILLLAMQKMGYYPPIWGAEKAAEETKTKNLGNIVSSVQIIIRDIENDVILPDGQQGEICVYSNTVMNGYMEEETDVYFSYNGKQFIRTGDIGYIQEGCLYLSGRLKNLIIRSGENIIPGEIEQHIIAYPGVYDVVVCGVPSISYGESVCANIQCADLNMNLDSLQEKLKKELPKYMVPEHYIIWEEFPLNASGKTDIKKICEEAVKKCAGL